MKDLTLRDGRRMLIVELTDLYGGDLRHLTHVKNRLESCRAYYKIVLILVSPEVGPGALPRWLRDYPLQVGVYIRPTSECDR